MTQTPVGAAPRVTLLTRSACHLCGPARQAVAAVCAAAGRQWAERDVDADPELRAEYGDRVPVVLLDGAEFASLTVDPASLRAALGVG